MPFTDLGTALILAATLAFFLGGAVKGIAGFGLPLVVVPILATVLDPKVSIALMAVPVLASNVWLVWQGGRVASTLSRFWPLLVAMIGFTVASAQFLTRIEAGTAALILGLAVLAFCALQVLPVRWTVPPKSEGWLNPVVGAAAGTVGGFSNFFGPVVIAYLVALRLPKDLFVATVALFFLASGLPLYGTLAFSGILDDRILLASVIASIVVLAGVALGSRLRDFIPQQTFHRALIALLFLIALNLVRRGLGWTF